MSAATRPTPSGRERLLGPEDVIVSKTDLRGHLTYVNHTFLEISGYAEDDLMGRPHNVIRHPEMPRAVFQLLWNELRAGREVFAYVVNLSADGSHYWVLAHVTPTFSPAGAIVGYHSNRRSPSRVGVAHAKAVYAQLCEAEAPHATANAATAAGAAALQGLLDEQAITYDEWVWSLTGHHGSEVA